MSIKRGPVVAFSLPGGRLAPCPLSLTPQSKRDARVDNYTHADTTIFRKKLQTKFKYIYIEQNRK